MIKKLCHTLGISNETFSSNFARIFVLLVSAIVAVTPKFYEDKYLMVLWTIFFLFTYKYYLLANRQLKQISILGAIFVLLCIVYWLLGISDAGFSYCMAAPFVYFAPIIGLIFIDQCYNHNQLRFIFHFISLVVAVNVADSIWLVHSFGIENLVYQNIADFLGDEGFDGLNLGGAMYVNMIVFYANVMFLTFLNTTDRIERFLFFLYFSICTYFIVICSLKASAILLLLASILLQYIAHKGKRNFGIIILLSSLFLGILFVFRDSLINLFINIIDSERITSRLEVLATGATVTDNTSFAGREDLWQTSLHSWLKNPITFLFGIGDHDWRLFLYTADSGIGNHSDFFDVFGRYGLLGGIVFYFSLIKYYNFLQNKFGMVFKWEIIAFFIIIILMGITKRFVSGEPAIVIFLLFPLCLEHISTIQSTQIEIDNTKTSKL